MSAMGGKRTLALRQFGIAGTPRARVAHNVNAFAVMSREHFLSFEVQAAAPLTPCCWPRLPIDWPRISAPVSGDGPKRLIRRRPLMNWSRWQLVEGRRSASDTLLLWQQTKSAGSMP